MVVRFDSNLNLILNFEAAQQLSLEISKHPSLPSSLKAGWNL